MKDSFKKKREREKESSFNDTLDFAFCLPGSELFLTSGQLASYVLFKQARAADKSVEKPASWFASFSR